MIPNSKAVPAAGEAATSDTGVSSCCTPVRSGSLAAEVKAPSISPIHGAIPDRCVRVPGGRALVGTNTPLLAIDGEAPARQVRVAAFAIDPYAVTNEAFARFVDQTGYVTEAERFGCSFVFYSLLPEDAEPTQGVIGAVWWRNVPGAFWRAPEGPGSDLIGRERHPVVQVSLNDARAFASWAGGRLPTEAEWEHAARGGRGDVIYPWGDRAPDDNEFMPCNIWQGRFPEHDMAADGWHGTCPVDAFGPNGYGLHNMCGNVWEWCDQPLRIRSTKKVLRAVDRDAVSKGLMLTKGGSYLCHHTYCHRYRIAARSGNTSDSATGHIGFRLVYDLPGEQRS